MRIANIGAGYVGLATGIGLIKLGHKVSLVDINSQKVNRINQGQTPFYEPGLEPLLRNYIGGDLRISMDMDDAVRSAQVVFICVQTPCDGNGIIDLSYVKRAAMDLGKALRGSRCCPVVVVKSTIIPGTTEEVVLPVLEATSGKKAGTDFGVVVNPEFLREGKAIEDFLHPSRIILGELDKRSGDIMCELYKDLNAPILRVNFKTAEMIKYASNAFLATKISFINEVGNISKLMGIDVYKVAEAMGLDPRISPHFLEAGIGFGGSCLPKDTRALAAKARELGYQPTLLEGVLRVNEEQPLRLVRLAETRVGNLYGKTVAALGLAFKAETDDVRESAPIAVVQELLAKGAQVRVYDPMLGERAKVIFGDRVDYCRDVKEAVSDIALVFILTDWHEFNDTKLYRGKKVFVGGWCSSLE